jgi:hypothetical protein
LQVVEVEQVKVVLRLVVDLVVEQEVLTQVLLVQQEHQEQLTLAVAVVVVGMELVEQEVLELLLLEDQVL